ncbi:MAG: hypothetical protein IT343_19135 [Candidatus Melainabacteria bacterium]|jgi:hypothetical protein|nr:hypothetical protein [Candidatus Melainabacteria bacterium]
MAKIEEEYLKRFRDAGLFVSVPYSSEHGWPDGVRVGKPITTPGNSIAGYDAAYITIGAVPEPPEMDAPMVVLYSTGEEWVIHSQECVPKLGPGDFINVWSTPEEAVKDVIDFYFGDPARMQAKADRQKQTAKRQNSQKQ